MMMLQHPEAILGGEKRPFTGSEFLESLREGREVYIYGEQVEDVTTHPGFRNAAVSVAQFYDALHDPKRTCSPRRPIPAPAATRTNSFRLPTPVRM
jgi:aromatic ring hydroxylase